MHHLRHAIPLVVLALVASGAVRKDDGPVSRQTRFVYGHVTSASDQKPLEGVTIVVKGRTVGTMTNRDGVFQLSGVPMDTVVLRFRQPCHFAVDVVVPADDDSEVSVGLPLNRRALREAGCGGRGKY